jgi:hypothetical protein
MRPNLARPLGGDQHAHRRRARRGARTPDPVLRSCDPAVQRVREAGGPVDQASYTCACGYLFSADVSTSVACPHCGADQAW